MEPLCGRGHRLEFTLAGGDGPDYPGEFVGDSNRGFVVSPRAVDLPRPGAELVGRALADVGCSEHGASALREERTEVGVATLGDAPEAANVRCLRCLLLVMCTYPFAKKALTIHLARGESRERYFGCNLMQRKVLASSHQHLMAEAPNLAPGS